MNRWAYLAIIMFFIGNIASYAFSLVIYNQGFRETGVIVFILSGIWSFCLYKMIKSIL